MAKKSASKNNAPTSRQMLQSYIDRVMRVEIERAELSADIKQIYAEAKSEGFDAKALKKIVREQMQTETHRAAARETESLVDVYRAALGMLDGTPLGDAARRRFEGARADDETDQDDAGSDADAGDGEYMPSPIKDRQAARDDARAQGASDHAAKKRVVENPYPAATEERAAWDEGWCEAAGSDGMGRAGSMAQAQALRHRSDGSLIDGARRKSRDLRRLSVEVAKR